ncbi:hypothetical protein KFL_001100080 [Klebsormidium nitens]|uniref:DUF1995 domain-containing protein n=1 Tax=Klebsormidium nitens TaxID=105231 RepID=A0A1Y1HUU6_KLENI|nr:hypothetical protein KFL_001100080 [Klebsormidium nitens]|eukprot:GAQ82394.1 hypothetical protein KFL_001100080 [Klebsormidium nitens]
MVKFLAKQGRRKGGIASQLRLQIEVPVADETPEAQIQLAREVCDGAFSDKKGAPLSVAIFVASEKVRRVAAEELQSIGEAPVASVQTLREGETFPDNAGAVLLLGPKEEQIAHLRSIVGTAGSRPIVVLNPEWPDASEAEENNKAFVASFDVCYSFLPLNIEAMLSKFEGAVLKFVRSGPPQGAPWVIFVKGNEGLKPVKTYKSRPTAKDLEDIFYNYSASQSPVNKGIGFLRGLVGKGKK